MCNSCFNIEIQSFNTQDEFEKFDLELSKKIKPISNSGIKYIGNSDFAFDMGFGKYLCQNCNTEWWYSEPDQAWRGFFVRKENGKRAISKYQQGTKKKAFGCLIVLIIITIIVWFILS